MERSDYQPLYSLLLRWKLGANWQLELAVVGEFKILRRCLIHPSAVRQQLLYYSDNIRIYDNMSCEYSIMRIRWRSLPMQIHQGWITICSRSCHSRRRKGRAAVVIHKGDSVVPLLNNSAFLFKTSFFNFLIGFSTPPKINVYQSGFCDGV